MDCPKRASSPRSLPVAASVTAFTRRFPYPGMQYRAADAPFCTPLSLRLLLNNFVPKESQVLKALLRKVTH